MLPPAPLVFVLLWTEHNQTRCALPPPPLTFVLLLTKHNHTQHLLPPAPLIFVLLLIKHNQTLHALPPPPLIFVLLLTKHNKTIRALPPPPLIFVLLLTRHYACFLLSMQFEFQSCARMVKETRKVCTFFQCCLQISNRIGVKGSTKHWLCLRLNTWSIPEFFTEGAHGPTALSCFT